MKKMLMFALAAVMVFGLTACGEDELDSDLFSADPNSKLQVTNVGNDQLVLFKAQSGQSTGIGTVLGGVPSLARRWGVPNIKSTDGMFVLNIVLYSDYQASKATPGVSPAIASSMLIYVDSTTANYDISAGPVGNARIRFKNNTSNYVEIRGGQIVEASWYSPVFTVIRPDENKALYVQPDDYALFPVLIIERKSPGTAGGMTVTGLVSKRLTALAKPYAIYDNDDTPVQIPSTAGQGALHTVAYLVVNNQGSAVWLMNGDQIFKNSLGRELTRTGATPSQYIINMEGVSGASSTNNLVLQKPMQFSIKDPISQNTLDSMADTFSFQAGDVYMLTINATGQFVLPIQRNGTFDELYPEESNPQ